MAVALPAVALGLALALAPSASAGQATLWSCHGPGGQALGVQPLVAAAGGDGVITTYGTGCAAPASVLADGGLRAAFTRVDPAGGSQALWRFDVPASVTLQSVRLVRRTSGFGGAAVPGGAQSYTLQTSSAALETASVEDASNVPLDGVLDAPAAGIYARFGVVCAKPQLGRCAPATGAALGVDASSIALRVSDVQPPSGAVGGIASPAAGTLHLSAFATDGGLGLASARATLDGALVALADLGGAACAELSAQDATIDLPAGGACPASVSGVGLDVVTTGVPDGAHVLQVVVRDAVGNEAMVADEQIIVRNTSRPTSSQAILSLGAGGVAGSAAGGGGGAGGGGATPSSTVTTTTTTPGPVCARPRLSMTLRSRPLRTFRGVPVLSRSVAYRFSGRLTCLISGRRAAAPRGTVVEILSVVGKKIRSDGGVVTKTRGAVSVLLRYPSSRIVRFRHRSADGTSARVNIRIAVARPRVQPR